MYKIQPLIDHIEKVYGFEVVPCSMPRSNFQYFKRYIYILIHDKISKKLFFFLRDKVSPIKFLDERPNKELWFHKRNSLGRISFEIEIRPIPVEACIYLSHDSGFFKTMDENFKVKIYHQLSDVEHVSFPLNHVNGTNQIDYYFSKFNELKEDLRNYKLNNILK